MQAFHVFRRPLIRGKAHLQSAWRTSVAVAPLYHQFSTRSGKSDEMTTATTLKGQPLDRAVLDSMLRRRVFYTPSFEVRSMGFR